MKQPQKTSNKRKAAPIGASKSGPSSGPSNKKAKTGKSSASASAFEINPRSGKPARRPDQPKKVKLRDQRFIPVPQSAFTSNGACDDDDDEEEDDGDHGMLVDGDSEGEDEMEMLKSGGAAFAAGVDTQAISRSKKETLRLHTLQKEREPLPKPSKKKRQLSISSVSTVSSMSDDDEDLDSDMSVDEEEEPKPKAANGKGKGKAKAVEGDEEEDGYESGYTLSEGELDGSGDESPEDDSEMDDDSDLDSDDDDDDDDEADTSEDEAQHRVRRKNKKDNEREADYELLGRRGKKGKGNGDDDDAVKLEEDVGHLPIKLPNGQIEYVPGTTRIAIPVAPAPKGGVKVKKEELSDNEFSSASEDEDEGEKAEKLASKKGRFGRMGIVEVLTREEGVDGGRLKGKRKAEVRLGWAKEEIAKVGAEIMGGGELLDNLPLLTRLSTFALVRVRNPENDQPPIPVPNSIRGLAFLSQMAVYKDLIPGYRIRELTAVEEAEKVRAEVKRLREGEKGLVKSYKQYLKTLEGEIKKRTPLISLSLRCMCELLTSSPHFNFSDNLMGVIVGRLSRRSWDADSEVCLQAIIKVFRDDVGSRYSQNLLRLIARMIKERKYRVHPNVMDALLALRLRSELSLEKDGSMRYKRGGGKGKGKEGEQKVKSEVRKQWMTKNRRKAEKERKEVEREMEEAEAEVDVEERSRNQTETLKNLFVLYFSILKQTRRSPLLPAALEGLSKFAHLVNIEFFRDLMIVLKKIISGEMYDLEEASDDEEGGGAGMGPDVVGRGVDVRLRMVTIVTAFELLSGQGEALNIDLNDFIVQFYGLLQPLSLDTNIEQVPTPRAGTRQPSQKNLKSSKPTKHALMASTADLMFRCLNLIFFSRHSSTANSPPWRAAAFAKRLLECALQFPTATAQKSIAFVKQLVNKEAKLEAFLSSEDRTADGVYRPDLADPQLVNPFATSFWELGLLQRDHWDDNLREQAGKLASGSFV